MLRLIARLSNWILDCPSFAGARLEIRQRPKKPVGPFRSAKTVRTAKVGYEQEKPRFKGCRTTESSPFEELLFDCQASVGRAGTTRAAENGVLVDCGRVGKHLLAWGADLACSPVFVPGRNAANPERPSTNRKAHQSASLEAHPTIDQQLCPDGKRCLIRSKKHDGIGDLTRLSEPSNGNLPDEPSLSCSDLPA